MDNENEADILATLPCPERVRETFRAYRRPIHESVCCVASIPRYGTNSHSDCLYRIVSELGIRVDRQQGVYWDQCLTVVMQAAIDRGYEYCLTVDHDSIFEPRDVRTLWDIMRQRYDIDALCGCQVARERDQPLLMPTDATGQFWRPITPEELAAQTVRVKTAHFGLTLFRVPSLARLPKPWFLPVPDPRGEWGEGHIDSDINFWAGWWKAGLTLHQANHVVIGHAQEMISWPGPDLRPRHQYLGQYRESGRPTTSLNYREPSNGSD